MFSQDEDLDEFVLLRTCNTKQEASEIETRLDAEGIYPRFEQSKQFSKSTCCSCGTPLIDLLVRHSQKNRSLQIIEQMELQLEKEALSCPLPSENPKTTNKYKQQYHLEEKDHTANVIFNGLAVIIALMIVIAFLVFTFS